MADFDYSWDRLDRLRDIAVAQVEGMLREDTNEYQAPSWLQAMGMLVEMETLLAPSVEMHYLNNVLNSIRQRWVQAEAELWSTQAKAYADCLARMLRG